MKTEKKFQVFISSTYVDLVEERKEVIQALLELDCIPVGMELFPAANEDQWTLIKELIDTCDYYILIVGGRYGSLNSEGISYTQMEYEYAIQMKIPVISFIPKEPENIKVGKTDQDQEKRKKLLDFMSIVQQKMCKHYSNPIELGSAASRSIIKLIKKHPAIGWVRGDIISSDEASKEIILLNKRIKDLEKELNNIKTLPPRESGNLQQGNDEYEIHFEITLMHDPKAEDMFSLSYKREYKSFRESMTCTWDEIFYSISPYLIDEEVETTLKNSLKTKFEELKDDSLRKQIKKNKPFKLYKIEIIDDHFQTIKVQLRALGLMTESIKKRSLNENRTFWTLTPFGSNSMNRLRALKKQEIIKR